MSSVLLGCFGFGGDGHREFQKAYPFRGESLTSVHIVGVLWTQESFDLSDQTYSGRGERRSSTPGWWFEMAGSGRTAMGLSQFSSPHVPSSRSRDKIPLFCHL